MKKVKILFFFTITLICVTEAQEISFYTYNLDYFRYNQYIFPSRNIIKENKIRCIKLFSVQNKTIDNKPFEILKFDINGNNISTSILLNDSITYFILDTLVFDYRFVEPIMISNSFNSSKNQVFTFTIMNITDSSNITNYLSKFSNAVNYTIILIDSQGRNREMFTYVSKDLYSSIKYVYKDESSIYYSEKIVKKGQIQTLYEYKDGILLKKIDANIDILTNTKSIKSERKEYIANKKENNLSVISETEEVKDVSNDKIICNEIKLFNDTIVLQTFPYWAKKKMIDPSGVTSTFKFIGYLFIPDWFQSLDLVNESIKYIEFKSDKIIHSSFQFEKFSRRYYTYEYDEKIILKRITSSNNYKSKQIYVEYEYFNR